MKSQAAEVGKSRRRRRLEIAGGGGGLKSGGGGRRKCWWKRRQRDRRHLRRLPRSQESRGSESKQHVGCRRHRPRAIRCAREAPLRERFTRRAFESTDRCDAARFSDAASPVERHLEQHDTTITHLRRIVRHFHRDRIGGVSRRLAPVLRRLADGRRVTSGPAAGRRPAIVMGISMAASTPSGPAIRAGSNRNVDIASNTICV